MSDRDAIKVRARVAIERANEVLNRPWVATDATDAGPPSSAEEILRVGGVGPDTTPATWKLARSIADGSLEQVSADDLREMLNDLLPLVARAEIVGMLAAREADAERNGRLVLNEFNRRVAEINRDLRAAPRSEATLSRRAAVLQVIQAALNASGRRPRYKELERALLTEHQIEARAETLRKDVAALRKEGRLI